MSSTAALLLAATLAAMASPTPAPSPTPEPELTFSVGALPSPTPALQTLRFSHAVHTARRLKTRCADCHRLGLDGNRFRPADDAACTACHKDDGAIAAFRASLASRAPAPRTQPVEPIHRIHLYYRCSRCHESVELSEQVGDIPLPPADNAHEVCVQCHGRAVRFSHAAHVRADGKVGADCALCHPVRPDGLQYGVPGHPQCWQCHDINLLGLTEGCNLCHLRDTRAPKTYDLERASTLHKEHPRADVACTRCHAGILSATTLDEVQQARAGAASESCTSCHALPR